MPLYAIDGAQPRLEEGAWAASSADLIGNVHLAARDIRWGDTRLERATAVLRNVHIRPSTQPENYWQVYCDTNRVILETFREAGYPTPETPISHRNA